MTALARLIVFALYVGCLILIAPLSLWLLLNALTWTGRGLALVGLLALIFPAGLFLQNRTKSPRWRYLNLVLSFALLGLMVVILLTTPSGYPDAESPVSHQFTTDAQFRRYHLTNIIPEAEQINLGFLVMPILDPIFNHGQAQRVSGFTMNLYREIEWDANFRELGTVLGWAYDEVLGQPFDVGHYYLYVPKNHPEGPLSAIVFLHGSLGNFKPYLWVWSQFAEEAGVVIIAPSFGFGNWLQPGGTEAILAALLHAGDQIALDSERIYLAGISNGGLGVSKLGEVTPDIFRGLIFLSPVMPGDIVVESTFLRAWQDRPVLIITGQADRRIPLTYVQQRTRQFEAWGIDVTEIVYPKEDHFLFYSQPEEILDHVGEWMAAQTDTSGVR